uniref:Secreted protein n=1 Tax=Pyxicephalus adspersus TaxID=30357 RepID=A0AAV2ZYI0_PYXAD|nr:TPA: hypothetical protein GDO54_012998 [Pyxicephalus adspersus]
MFCIVVTCASISIICLQAVEAVFVESLVWSRIPSVPRGHQVVWRSQRFFSYCFIGMFHVNTSQGTGPICSFLPSLPLLQPDPECSHLCFLVQCMCEVLKERFS